MVESGKFLQVGSGEDEIVLDFLYKRLEISAKCNFVPPKIKSGEIIQINLVHICHL